MLTYLAIKNFKAHANTELVPRRITLFIGPNNGGKSSVGQALMLLRQSVSRASAQLATPVQRKATSTNDPYLYPEDQLIDLGDFEHIVRKGQQHMEIELGGNLNIARPSGRPQKYSLDLELGIRNNSLFFHRGRIVFATPQTPEAHELTWKWEAGMQAPQPPVSLYYSRSLAQFSPVGNFTLLSSMGIVMAPNTDAESSNEIQVLFNQVSQVPVALLRSVHPVFPLRGLEERGSPLTDAPAKNLERMFVADRTVALLSMLAYDLDLQERVSTWLDRLVQLRLKVPLLPGKRVTLLAVPTNSPSASDSLFMNEGTGANQLPFILIPIGITPPGETILLAEPEVHLHPKLQSKLMSLLLDLAREENRQFIIETHSEHILHSVLYAVAKGELSKDDLAIYYFEKKNGITESRLLDVSQMGQIEGGLPGFFEQSVDELSEYLEALKKNS